MENIGEVALYVNAKVSTTYAVLGLGYGGRAFEAYQGQGGISLQRWNLLGVGSFFAKSGETPPLTPMAVFKIRRVKSQSDNQDLYISHPQ